jgi:hypothetical protein
MNAPAHACLESFPPEERCRGVASSLSKRIVEVEYLVSQVHQAVQRVAALLKKDVGVTQVVIDPTLITAVLHGPTPAQYKIAFNTLSGFQVDDAGEVLEGPDGNLLLLPGEE